jgi:peptide deformylase
MRGNWPTLCLRPCYEAQGIGLAATDERPRRFIVVDVSESRDQPVVLINPEIVRVVMKLG